MRVAVPLFTLRLPWLSVVCGAGSGRKEEGEGKGRLYPCEQLRFLAFTLCLGNVAQATNSKFKELKDMEVSSNQRTSGGQSLTNEAPHSLKSNNGVYFSAENTLRDRKARHSGRALCRCLRDRGVQGRVPGRQGWRVPQLACSFWGQQPSFAVGMQAIREVGFGERAGSPSPSTCSIGREVRRLLVTVEVAATLRK